MAVLPQLFNHISTAGTAGTAGTLLREERIMAQCIAEAYKYRGTVSPNPCVGAAVVVEGDIVALEAHQRCGSLHAERLAIGSALTRLYGMPSTSETPSNTGTLPVGSELFITLEPCSTHGRTPPCTDIIISSGVKRVYVAILDPNPRHSGGGIDILRNHGIHVSVGVMAESATTLLAPFAKGITTQTPYIFAKIAQTLDGYTTDSFGTSKWITGLPAREHVHALRHGADAILTGIGSILADDSILDTRLHTTTTPAQHRNPSVIIADTHCRTPLSSKIVQRYASQLTNGGENGGENAGENGGENGGKANADMLYILTGEPQHAPQVQKLNNLSSRISVITVATETVNNTPRLNLLHMVQTIYKLGFNNVMLEAGSTLTSAMLHENHIDAIHMFIAPKLIFGGTNALQTPQPPQGIKLNNATTLQLKHSQQIGEDALLEFNVFRVLKFYV